LIIDYCLLIGECLYYKIRKDKLIGEAQLTKIRNGEIASKETLNTICKLKFPIHLFKVCIMH